ncbi:50S ribosomal protein L24e [uncultured archaeon]|nr:50S ribosomal protein L24e [uncultured archaeon]
MKCAFSGKEIPIGTGIKCFKKDGSALYFANRKAERSFQMKKKATNLKWTGKTTKHKSEKPTQKQEAPVQVKPEAAQAKKQEAPKQEVKKVN